MYVAIACSALAPIANGMISYESSTLVFGTIASYDCDSGFFPIGNSARICDGDGSSARGMWNGTAPVCSSTCSIL